MKELRRALAAHPFLEGLDAKHVRRLARHARSWTFRPGETILREGAPADASYLLVSGRVALEIHAPGRGGLAVGTVGGGEVLGWSWIARDRHWHFDARALAPVEAIALDGKRLARRCRKDPELGYEMMRRFLAVVTSRLEAVRLQLVDVYGKGRVSLPWA